MLKVDMYQRMSPGTIAMVLAKSILQLAPRRLAISNLLIVEDSDADFLLTKRKMIKLLDPEIIDRACNRSELIRTLLSPRDFIVTDLHLGDIEDGELLKAIHNAQPHTPCLVMTGGSLAYANSDEMPANVFGMVEKGDYFALEQMLLKYSVR
jgi:DNA-binding NtrC family response regulator